MDHWIIIYVCVAAVVATAGTGEETAVGFLKERDVVAVCRAARLDAAQAMEDLRRERKLEYAGRAGEAGSPAAPVEAGQAAELKEAVTRLGAATAALEAALAAAAARDRQREEEHEAALRRLERVAAAWSAATEEVKVDRAAVADWSYSSLILNGLMYATQPGMSGLLLAYGWSFCSGWRRFRYWLAAAACSWIMALSWLLMVLGFWAEKCGGRTWASFRATWSGLGCASWCGQCGGCRGEAAAVADPELEEVAVTGQHAGGGEGIRPAQVEAVQQLLPGGAAALVRTVLAAVGPAALLELVTAAIPRPSFMGWVLGGRRNAAPME
jgi:hypothetical protein